MKNWLRLLLITVSVGGGFCGIVVMVQSLVALHGHRGSWTLVLGLLLYVFVTVAGLVFVHDSRRTDPLFAALLLQVPWFSSPIISYRFAAGLEARAGFVGGSLKWGLAFGAWFDFGLFAGDSWGGEVNFIALVLLLALWQSLKRRGANLLPASTKASADQPFTT